ncbi:MAG: succinyl-diaminopimelate desuccinylase, partial [Burkholderiales bacterium]
QLTNKSIAILLTSDEEGAATDGTIVMVEYLKQQGITLDYCLLGEPTSVNNLGDVIKIGRRGSLTGKLEIVGKQGHIAYPELCRNPIHMFAEALLELSKISWDNGNEYFPATTLQFANLNAGLGVDNVVPGTLYTSFNFRYNNLHTAESLSKRFTDILDQHQLPYKIKWNNSAKPFLTLPGRLIAVISDAIKHQQSITPQLKTDGGTSDGRFLVEVAKELVECGLSNMHIHQVGENICKTDLFDLANLYYIILNKIFNE